MIVPLLKKGNTFDSQDQDIRKQWYKKEELLNKRGIYIANLQESKKIFDIKKSDDFIDEVNIGLNDKIISTLVIPNYEFFILQDKTNRLNVTIDVLQKKAITNHSLSLFHLSIICIIKSN